MKSSSDSLLMWISIKVVSKIKIMIWNLTEYHTRKSSTTSNLLRNSNHHFMTITPPNTKLKMKNPNKRKRFLIWSKFPKDKHWIYRTAERRALNQWKVTNQRIKVELKANSSAKKIKNLKNQNQSLIKSCFLLRGTLSIQILVNQMQTLSLQKRIWMTQHLQVLRRNRNLKVATN